MRERGQCGNIQKNYFGYPAPKSVMGPQQFGCNRKTYIMHFIVYIPVCAALAWICPLL